MSISVFLKSKLGSVISSPILGQIINFLPYNMRPGIGGVYAQRKKEISLLNSLTNEEKHDFVFVRLKKLCEYAYANIDFYKKHYDAKGFDPSSLKSFADLSNIPIISKKLLNQYSLEMRSNPNIPSYIVNTGGTSGTPFSFSIQPDSMGHEWAHMHAIWRELNYKPQSFKLVFGGRSNVKNLIDYDSVRNSFFYDIYAPFIEVERRLVMISERHEIEYLHGYPSSIYQFALDCKTNNSVLIERFSKSLKGVFLGSEFPHALYRETIEKTFGAKTISWYGHTERAVLASERSENFVYYPFLSYGFTEAVENKYGSHNLVSTSYYNFASPLIRYDTEDLIDNVDIVNGILNSFEVRNGRSGENIIDFEGNLINLTGLIFGRHHKIFSYIDFIQVKQLAIGEVMVYYVSKNRQKLDEYELFDTTNVRIHFSFKSIDKPFRSKAGKVNLLIKE